MEKICGICGKPSTPINHATHFGNMYYCKNCLEKQKVAKLNIKYPKYIRIDNKKDNKYYILYLHGKPYKDMGEYVLKMKADVIKTNNKSVTENMDVCVTLDVFDKDGCTYDIDLRVLTKAEALAYAL